MEQPDAKNILTESSSYQIVIDTRVANGYVESGKFFLGSNYEEVMELYNQLQGTEPVGLKDMLRMHLVETENSVDSILFSIGCSLDEIAENVKVIIKETFRTLNLI